MKYENSKGLYATASSCRGQGFDEQIAGLLMARASQTGRISQGMK